MSPSKLALEKKLTCTYSAFSLFSLSKRLNLNTFINIVYTFNRLYLSKPKEKYDRFKS